MNSTAKLPNLNSLLIAPIDELITLLKYYEKLLIVTKLVKGENSLKGIILSETITRLRLVIDSRVVDIFEKYSINLN